MKFNKKFFLEYNNNINDFFNNFINTKIELENFEDTLSMFKALVKKSFIHNIHNDEIEKNFAFGVLLENIKLIEENKTNKIVIPNLINYINVLIELQQKELKKFTGTVKSEEKYYLKCLHQQFMSDDLNDKELIHIYKNMLKTTLLKEFHFNKSFNPERKVFLSEFSKYQNDKFINLEKKYKEKLINIEFKKVQIDMISKMKEYNKSFIEYERIRVVAKKEIEKIFEQKNNKIVKF